MKTNTILIDIYLRKLIQRLITNINLQELNQSYCDNNASNSQQFNFKKRSKIKVAQKFSSIKAKINREVT